ncbi:MAG: hypothetical protein KGV50_03310, partial [Gammaproteobacteria bacterium]|nr:hypothetical protein [Gammaproteobacteria bacterium]
MLVPTLSSAVGLGSVRTYSGLNEHLRAEIPVLSVKTREDMQVNLAPNSVFAQSGVSRTKVIDDLRFFLVERNGRIYVRVKSSKQVNVPYLNFILQLKSAEGVVSREYAIFLDPQKPGKRKAKMPAAKPLSKYSKRKHSNAVRPVPVTQQKVDNVHQIKNIETSNLSAGKYGPVRKGETLWSIASHVRPSEAISVRKMLKL